MLGFSPSLNLAHMVESVARTSKKNCHEISCSLGVPDSAADSVSPPNHPVFAKCTFVNDSLEPQSICKAGMTMTTSALQGQRTVVFGPALRYCCSKYLVSITHQVCISDPQRACACAGSSSDTHMCVYELVQLSKQPYELFMIIILLPQTWKLPQRGSALGQGHGLHC